jgi:hypothetical protein
MQLSFRVFHARHLPFDWRQETRRERVPSAPPIFEGNWKPNGSLTPPPSFGKLGKVGTVLQVHSQKRTHIELKHRRVLI